MKKALILLAMTTILASSTACGRKTIDHTPDSYITYEIKHGDTMTSIAKEFGSNVDTRAYINEVCSMNQMHNANAINAGCYLMIPIYK